MVFRPPACWAMGFWSSLNRVVVRWIKYSAQGLAPEVSSYWHRDRTSICHLPLLRLDEYPLTRASVSARLRVSHRPRKEGRLEYGSVAPLPWPGYRQHDATSKLQLRIYRERSDSDRDTNRRSSVYRRHVTVEKSPEGARWSALNARRSIKGPSIIVELCCGPSSPMP